MADRFVELIVGSKPTPDTARFRIGQFTMWAEVGKDSTRFDIAEMTVDYSLEGVLPQATLQVPLGTAVGPLTANKTQSSSNTVRGLLRSFAKFTPVKVYVEFGEPAISETDIGYAHPSGKKLVFSGRVLSTSYAREGNSVVGIQVQCTHRMLGIMSGTSIFSKIVSASDSDLQQMLTAWNDPIKIPEPQANVWQMFLDQVKDLVDNTTPSSKKFATDVLDEKSLESLNKILGELKPSADMLNEVQGLITAKYTQTDAMSALGTVAAMIKRLLMGSRASGNFLASIGRFGQELFFRPMFTADKGYMLPYQPCWSSSKMKYLRGGANFGTANDTGVPYAGLVESMQIAGTIVVAAMTTDWEADSKDPRSFLYSGGVYTIPNTDQEFNIADTEFAPGWANRLSLFPSASDPSAPTKEEVKPASDVVASTPATKTQGDTKEKQKSLEFRNTFVTQFARFRTLDKVFGGNSLQFTCALRDDIVPGMNLAVVVGSSANEDDELCVYGYVQRVRCEIKVSEGEGMAIQTVTMTHVRNEVEQADIVDKDYAFHFFWEDAEDKINAIRLWS